MAGELYPDASDFSTNPRIEEFLDAAVPSSIGSQTEEDSPNNKGKAKKFDQRDIARQAEAESRRRLGVDLPPEQAK